MQPKNPTYRRARTLRLTRFAQEALFEDAQARLRFVAQNGTDDQYLEALEAARLARIALREGQK